MKYIVNIEGRMVVEAQDREEAKEIAEAEVARRYPGFKVGYGDPVMAIEAGSPRITQDARVYPS